MYRRQSLFGSFISTIPLIVSQRWGRHAERVAPLHGGVPPLVENECEWATESM